MPFFESEVISTIHQSIKRESFLNDIDRRELSSELIDTYKGFGREYLVKHIESATHKKYVSKTLSKIATQFQFLTHFINQISQLYNSQPRRAFLINGKELENDRIKSIVNGFYTKENQLKIREAERLTNLLDTTIWKVNNVGGELKLDFIPNNVVQVVPFERDNTIMKSLRFLSLNEHLSFNRFNTTTETWDQESVVITNSNNQTITEENEAATKYTGATGKSFIGPGFPPFAVLRSAVATEDFWNLSNEDTVCLIKEFNLAITELRYLMRYSSFGLKYLVNLEAPTDGIIDPTGIWQLAQQNSAPGNEKQFEVGELKNTSDIKSVMDSITSLMGMIYNIFGLDPDSLVSSRDAETAESKRMDMDRLRKMIEGAKPIWAMNEDHIFEAFVSVWNRDNPSNSIPYDIELKVDFEEIELSIEEQLLETELWMVKIQNNVSNITDWIISDNNDLNTDEARLLFEKNVGINQSDMILTSDSSGDEEQEDNQA